MGGYEIVAPLGRGGMGEVYRARDARLARDVALKMLPEEFAADPGRLARFRREARILAALNHPNIAAIYGLEEDEARCLVLEFVEGQTLAERIRDAPLEAAEALDLCAQIASALEAAHEKGVVHRDLKPENVMVDARGMVKVLDFGIATAPAAGREGTTLTHLTARGGLVGTVPYMSPEQIRGEGATPRSDLWALGCVLYEGLAGVPAFARRTPAETASAILTEEPTMDALPRSVPSAIRILIERCLSRDPGSRPADAREVRLQLEDALRSALGVGDGAVAERGWRDSRFVLAAASLLGLLALVPFGGERLLPRSGEGGGFRVLSYDGRYLALAILLAVSVPTLAVRLLARRREWVRGASFRSGLLLAGLIVLAVACTVTLWMGRIYTSLLALTCACGLWLAFHRRSRLVISSLLSLGTVAIVITAFLSESRWLERAARIQDDTLDVYVVLPFEKLNDEKPAELLELSEHFRSTLEKVFLDLPALRVMPPVFDPGTLRSAPPQCSYQRVLAWTKGAEVSPDIVLCGTVDLFDDQEEHSGVTLVSSVSRVRGGRLDPMALRIKQTGTYDDMEWLALRASLDVLKAVRQDPGLSLPPEEERKAKRRILESYDVFLSFREAGGVAPSELVARALAREALEDEVLSEALDAYESPVDLAGYAARHAANREALRRRALN